MTDINTFIKEHNKSKEDIVGINEQLAEKATQTALDVEKARINSFTALAAGSTTGDAELIDARVGADGEIFVNAGSAIREQIGQLNKAVADNSLYATASGFPIIVNEALKTKIRNMTIANYDTDITVRIGGINLLNPNDIAQGSSTDTTINNRLHWIGCIKAVSGVTYTISCQGYKVCMQVSSQNTPQWADMSGLNSGWVANTYKWTCDEARNGMYVRVLFSAADTLSNLTPNQIYNLAVLSIGTNTKYVPYVGLQSATVNVSTQNGWENLKTYEGYNVVYADAQCTMSVTYAIETQKQFDCVNAYSFGISENKDDNYNEFTAAIAKAKTTTKRLFIPSGTYKCSKPLEIPSNFEIYGSGINTTSIVFGVTNGLVITTETSTIANEAQHVYIHDLCVAHSSETTYGKRAITTKEYFNLGYLNVDRVRIYRFSLGVCLYSTWMSRFSFVKVVESDSCGFLISSGTSCNFDNCYVVQSKNGFLLRSLHYSSLDCCAVDFAGYITTTSQDFGISDLAQNIVGISYQFIGGCYTLNACGTEGDTTKIDIYASYGCLVTFNGCYLTSKIMYADGRKIKIDTGKLIFNNSIFSTSYHTNTGAFIELIGDVSSSFAILNATTDNSSYSVGDVGATLLEEFARKVYKRN